ncbi:MAG: hypothetical protein ABI673_09425 [Novosphingobium sp.]
MFVQHDLARAALKQAHTDSLFQFGDQAADRGVGQLHALRSAGKAAALRNPDERLDLAIADTLFTHTPFYEK